MNPERWQLIQDLIDELRELGEPERLALLDSSTDGDPELRATLEGMLLAEREDSNFLEPPIQAPADSFAAPPALADYRFLEPIGQGGLGVIWLACQLSEDRQVAVKLLSERAVHLPENQKRFRREARAVAKLQHANIVRLLDSGLADSVPYLVFEYIRGMNLAQEIESRRERATPLGGDSQVDFLAVARLVRKVADALEHAHGLGIVHRDVKPHNILLHDDGEPYLLDFGIALTEGETTMTAGGMRPGTPAYMSPEQISMVREDVDHRTDVFSLGVVLYELLCGERAFDADTVQGTLLAITEREPRRLRKVAPQVPKHLERICAGSLEKSKDHRYATAAALRDDLDRFLDGRAPQWRRPPLGVRARRWTSKHRTETATLALAAVGSLLAIVFAVALLGPPREVSVALDVVPVAARAQVEVFALRLDPLHLTRSELLPLGGWPLDPAELEPGTYRFVARSPGYAPAEVLRALPAAGESVSYTLRLRAEGEAAPRLLPVPAGQVSLENRVVLGTEGDVTLGFDYRVAGFELQDLPVTNGAYAAFLSETGGDAPPHWAGPKPDDWDRRPTTGLRLDQARAFAEHYGLRLPTLPEMRLAAGGGLGWLYPWGNGLPPGLLDQLQVGQPKLNSNPDDLMSERDQEGRWYRNHVRAVDRDPAETRGPYGHGGLFGNAWIATESPHLDAPNGQLVATNFMYFLAGESALLSRTEIQERGTAGPYWQHAMKPDVYTGFRCARSLDPLALDPKTEITRLP